ncbi:hypothetical protein B5F53_04385 [Blautia sp. An249]|uniref:hypothetical protein n=1 Tax=Blautia sp. An249 TaxID=1965603 RepID=UPI000B394B68|nr:hypothetical protein [Blautia sp. An249]OUO80207.1 hypothetical protein B5F53_04385 [Blautia sp. An249]
MENKQEEKLMELVQKQQKLLRILCALLLVLALAIGGGCTYAGMKIQGLIEEMSESRQQLEELQKLTEDVDLEQLADALGSLQDLQNTLNTVKDAIGSFSIFGG